jgi:hypothetical protein
MQDWAQRSADRRPALVYVRQQVVNLDRIAEISVKRGRVTLCFAFARLGEPGARLVLSPAEAEPLLIGLRQVGPDLSAWVAIEDRLVNLDLVVDIWSTQDEIILVPALPDQNGGPLPRSFPRLAARSLLSYFEQNGRLSQDRAATPGPPLPAWITAGEHLVNLALVSGIRLGAQHIQVVFAGLPHFARSFSYGEARPLIERLQQMGALPIDAMHIATRQDSDGDPEPADDEPATGRRRRLGGWLVRRR